MPVLLFALLAAVILLIVSGGYVFVVGCVRRKEFPWFDEEKIKGTPDEKFYPFICATDRWLREHNAQDVYIKSEDGLKLHGLWVPAPSPKGTVLLAHGYRSTIFVEFHVAVAFFHALGFNLLIPDQRSHGQSEGRFITFGVKESGDMYRWITFHNEHYGTWPMLLFGISMGASTVLYLADRKLPDNVRGIVADCGFTSPKEILSSVFYNVTHLPAGPSLWVAEWFARVFAGFSLQEKDTRKALAASRYPVLLIHGTGDAFVPCEMTRQGYDACTGIKSVLMVEGAEHGYSVIRDPEHYAEALETFIKTHVEGFA